jgi:hypothetical protein
MNKIEKMISEASFEISEKEKADYSRLINRIYTQEIEAGYALAEAIEESEQEIESPDAFEARKQQALGFFA